MERLTKAEVKALIRIQQRLDDMATKYMCNDIELNHNNGTVSASLNCACAYLENILQDQ